MTAVTCTRTGSGADGLLRIDRADLDWATAASRPPTTWPEMLQEEHSLGSGPRAAPATPFTIPEFIGRVRVNYWKWTPQQE